MVEIILSSVALILSIVTSIFSILAYVSAEAARKSTHKIEYRPLRIDKGTQQPVAEEAEEEWNPPERPKGYPNFS